MTSVVFFEKIDNSFFYCFSFVHINLQSKILELARIRAIFGNRAAISISRIRLVFSTFFDGLA